MKDTRHKHNKLEDFLLDKEFKNWVIHPDPNNQLFWKKWIENHPEQRENIQQAREILLSYNFKEAEIVSQEEKEDILSQILNQSVSHDFKPKRPQFIWAYGIAAAIIFTLSFLSILFYYNSSNDIPKVKGGAMIVKQNPSGQKSKVSLPDGTQVWLNSDSKIEFPSEFKTERVINLDGEAYFEVVKNPKKPFKVNSGGVITTALGTSFNINAFQGNPNIEVMLVTGKVSVESRNDKSGKEQKIYITPGEQVTYNRENQTMGKSKYSSQLGLLWKEGIISFDKADFEVIRHKLERWYGVKIKADNLNRKLTYTGDFNNESLERVLERMAFSERFSFRIEDKNVYINFE